MSCPVHLRVVLGVDDARKLTLKSGMPSSVDQLVLEIKTYFGLEQQFRLQYKDLDFGNEYFNLESISDIEDKATVKVVFVSCEETSSSIPETSLPCSTSTPLTSPMTCNSSVILTLTSVNALRTTSPDEDGLSSQHSFDSGDAVILDPAPETRTSSWPPIFFVPRFSYFAEFQLQRATADFRANGTLLTPSPKLRMDILEGMAEEIFKCTAYPSDSQIEEAATVLVHTHPCLKERGTRAGHEGWKQYLKTKVANFRTKLNKIGHPEVSVNSLKNKRKGQEQAAANIKKPRKAEVNFLPPLPSGETRDSLEKERVVLLTEVKKRNNDAVVKKKMQKTFAYRRQEIVQDAPVVAELVNKWPALFTVSEINAEFMRITTLPLQAKFLAELDRYSPNLLKVFHNRGGDAGRKIRLLMAPTARSEDIELKRDSVLKSLCAYLKEDSNSLIKEYLNVRSEEAESAIPQTTMGLYVIRNEGAQEEDGPEDVGVIIEGVELLSNLRSISLGWAMLFGLIYTLNLSYPPELKFTFEFLQKVLMNLDGNKLSPKVQSLKIKMLQ
ncbi:sterile alpha motif domain-containing protein 3-like isoform X2 [Gymnodraco acuticeps]|nr:sterile alpha motif domain-containing protein 3-like isoform X2 [Gymnodraco acuticeps]XP_034082372.1 sterile alpha motif domain-containing protein 3-like isoform X2 [Gymnodraco acuticeps]XP_034082373.1 sterile alpha motif domain-containing protein 3-like isoform X2 [Gymnodraco acuticeps]XP_034082374.1 sterile alpha motif domain-containing protein 3-like isoform X2 [Gymnodraco acuticeps]